jgi:hypothetical protein
VIYATVGGIELRFENRANSNFTGQSGVALLSCITFAPNDKVLDLGCGYCLIGIYAAKIMGSGTCLERGPNVACGSRQGKETLKRAGRARVLSLRPREKSARRADRLSRGGVCGGGGQFRVDYEVEDFSLGQAH